MANTSVNVGRYLQKRRSCTPNITNQVKQKWITAEQISNERRETKTKPITYQLDYSANLKPQQNQNQTNYLPIRLLSQSQTIVKPKPNQLLTN